MATRRASTRRPAIGAPSDFRRVERSTERTGAFRPLELSIYRPGNELPSLPVFMEDPNEDERGLEFPSQVLTKARSDSMLSRPSMSFSIPRKPVASVGNFSNASRSSMDSRYTNDLNLALGTRSIQRRPSITTTQSTQDFLDTLDARLPQPQPRIRSKSGPEPVYTLYRRASEQSLRLRTHLEERENIERHLPECDTILEERQPGLLRKFPDLSPISSHDDSADDFAQYTPSHRHNKSQPEISPPVPLQSQVSLDKLLGIKSPHFSTSMSTRARISQWLLRSTSHSSPAAPSDHDAFPHRTSNIHHRASTVSSLSTATNTADFATPWSTPLSSPRRKPTSFSSCRTGVYARELGAGDDKNLAGIPVVVDVGIAY